ncbi:MAG: glycosyltransferase [Pseudonocardiales bacterium]|nr:MAG: glycosyltransferase [Pseudonocardiales bacterium]
MIDVVFPCLDEAAALPWILRRLPRGYRAIVADNGSTDGSAQVAARLGATVVHVPQRGFGAAVDAGVRSATADVVCICDADGTFDPQQFPRVVDPVVDGAADLVLGRRRPASRTAWPMHGRAANALLAARISRRESVTIHDIGPMRACRRAALLDLGLVDRRFGYPLEMVLRAARNGWRITEVDVDYLARAGGTKSKVTGSVRGSLRAARDMRTVLAR